MLNRRTHLGIVFVLTIAFVVGILYELNLNKEITVENNKTNALNYIQSAQEHIVLWKRYHNATHSEDASETIKAEYIKELIYALEKSKQLENTVSISQLNNSWKVYYNYFRAYMSFICSDVKKDKFCAEEAKLLITRIEELDNDPAKFTRKQREWLGDEGIMEELRHLKAYVMAIIYTHDKTSIKSKTDAIEALKSVGNRDILEQKEIHDDRILKKVFNLAFFSIEDAV